MRNVGLDEAQAGIKMAGWHHWLYGRESEWTPGVGDRQEGLACCDSWGHKESDMTEWLNWTEYIMRNAGLEEAQAGIKIARRNINNLRLQMTPPLWQKVKN